MADERETDREYIARDARAYADSTMGGASKRRSRRQRAAEEAERHDRHDRGGEEN
jgi:hypothetical protein